MIDDLDDLLMARLRGLALPTVKILPRRTPVSVARSV
jgi:hypothetical protein